MKGKLCLPMADLINWEKKKVEFMIRRELVGIRLQRKRTSSDLRTP